MEPRVSDTGHSTEETGMSAPKTIAHILPFDQPRGAQRYARELVSQFESSPDRHVIVTLFEGTPSGLRPDIELGLRQGKMRSMGFDPLVVRRLRQTFRDLSPAIVVGHGGEAAKYAAFAVGRTIPLVYLSIGSADGRLSRPMSRAMYRFYTGRSTLVVAVSEAVAVEARHQRVAGDKIVVIPNGRDADRYQVDRSSEDRPPRLIWIGQLDVTKRPEAFLGVVASLRSSGLDLDAWMVGDGPRAAELAELAVPAGVAMLGRREDVPKLLGDSDILVFTGAPPEGMPGVLIEAGMAGMPVVSTRVPGAAEVVEDDKTGVLVDIDDIERLTREVRRLVDDEDLRLSMGLRARERCVEQFSLAATVRMWQSVYDRVLGDRPGRRR